LENVRPLSSFWERAASVVAGGALVARGLKRRSIGGWFWVALGVELIRRGVTGRRSSSSHPAGSDDTKTIRFSAIPEPDLQEKVDVASDLSFPASDPPAY